MKVLYIFLTLLLSGCAAIPQQPATPTSWKKLVPFNYQRLVHAEVSQTSLRDREIEISAWKVKLVNESYKDLCVTARWQLFDMINHTSKGWVFVPARGEVFIGHMIQSPWFVGEKGSVYLEPVGFLQTLYVRKPNKILNCEYAEDL